MTMANKVTRLEYVLKYNINIQIRDNVIQFKPDEQKIYVTGMTVQPAVELKSATFLAHYPEGMDNTIAAAVKKIVNIRAVATPDKGLTNTVKSRTIKRASDAVKPDTNDDEQPVNEAADAPLPDTNIQILADRCNIQNQVEIKEGKFSIVTKSVEMAEFITWSESKKIKIFINNQEIKPKFEVEFLKAVFPQIDLTVYTK